MIEFVAPMNEKSPVFNTLSAMKKIASPYHICYETDDVMVLSFVPPPTVNLGGTRYVLENRTIMLTPLVSDENVKYRWTMADGSPATGLSSDTVKNPSC